MNDLKNKVIVITGGSGLIGKSICSELISYDSISINADINVVDNLEASEIYCDVTNIKSIKNAINKIVIKYGKIDGWINNAYPRTSDWGLGFENISSESWNKNVDLQLNSVFNCCQSILELMKKQKFGSIVNVSSIYGLVGPDFTVYNGTNMTMPAAYSAIKGGVINFTRYLASLYGQYGVRVNTVSPGGIYDNQPEIFVRQYCDKVPMKRMGLPSDISGPISFLLSDASKYITGHNLIVDGGWTII